MVLLQCGDCGVLLKSPEEAQYHGKNTCHTNYLETDEPMCYLVCNDCNKICSCRTMICVYMFVALAAKLAAVELVVIAGTITWYLLLMGGDKYLVELELPDLKFMVGALMDKVMWYLLLVGDDSSVNSTIPPDMCYQPPLQVSDNSESHFHEKRSGHTGGFQDKTAEVVEQKRRAREEYNCQKGRQYLQMILQARRRQLLRMPSKAGQMKECLETIKQNHKDDEAKVKAACSVLRRFVENVRRYPDEEKFRKIRISNAAFQEKVGSLLGGIEFLELCGFEKTEGGEFLYMPREKVYMEVLNSAEWELRNIE
ncbi:hypothetical protein FXO38_09214 [Capsicum annuum]|nr:hypothetical protein FXO38_09214 [Capsicum annuum]KAF3668681.1 hypothetical protein FXO37_09405 [Capsicum annuum]